MPARRVADVWPTWLPRFGCGCEPLGTYRATSGQHSGRQHVQRRTAQIRRDWLKRTDRNVASLAWSFAEERELRGFGGLVAIHIKAHAEDRKQRSQFTHHEEMNVRADELTHAITPDMPLYASFRRPVTCETTLWYQPTEYENVGRGAMYEVTGNAYKHITLTSQRRASTRRQLLKDGEMLATRVRMSTGRTRSDGASNRAAKLIHQRLPTDARIELWAGRESGELVCGCGHKLSWANRDQVGQLQWHMFACSLPEETDVRQRWLRAVCGETLRLISRTSRLRGLLCAAGLTRTTDELWQRRRIKSSTDVRPRCDGKVKPGGLTT